MAGQVIALQALANNGVSDAYKANFLLQGGAFATPASMGISGAKDDTESNYAAIKARVDALYPGAQNRYRRDQALATIFGWTAPQAEMMDSVNPADLGYASNWMMNHGMDAKFLNPTSIQDINSVLRPGADLQKWRRRLLDPNSGYSLSAADTQGLMGANGTDALQQALVKALSDSGMSKTSATNFQQAAADYSNNLTTLGSTLVPALSDLTTAVTTLTGVLDNGITPLGAGDPPALGPFHAAGRGIAASPLSSATRALISGDVSAAAGAFGIDPIALNGIVVAEGWKGTNYPGAGIGPMAVRKEVADADGFDPYNIGDNIRGGSAIFARLLKRFGGNYDVAAAAYTEGINGPGIQQFYATGDMSGLSQGGRNEIKNMEAYYKAAGGNIATLQLRADPVVVVIKTPNGQIVGKAPITLRGRAVPSGQRS